MKYIIILFIVLAYLPAWGQPNRKSDIEKCTEPAYSAKEFQRIADSMQMTIDELSDYPIIFPIKKSQRISSGFGIRLHPVYRVLQFHAGIDISGTKGTSVYATGNGKVIRKGYDLGYGNFIEIKHSGGFRSFYAHLSKTMVNVGDSVSIAEHIAYMGDTGISTGSHLHYEIRKGKRFLNPIKWGCCLFEMLRNEL